MLWGSRGCLGGQPAFHGAGMMRTSVSGKNSYFQTNLRKNVLRLMQEVHILQDYLKS